MNKINPKTVKAVFDLIEEDDLSTSFKRFKLTHELAFIRTKTTDPTIQDSIDYIMENILGARNFEIVGEINLLTYYSLPELQDINNTLGLPKENTKLSEQVLDSIYSREKRSPELKELYYQLKWKHFKRPEHYDDVNYQALTSITDRQQYEKERANESR